MHIHFVTASFNRNKPKQLIIKSLKHKVSISSYDDYNFPSRRLAMHPRLKGKVPKMLEWKFVDADWYVWLDDSFTVITDTLAEDVLKVAGKNKLCLFKHPNRNSIKEEFEFMQKKLSHKSLYLYSRYDGEPIEEQVDHYLNDPSFKDNNLFSMGFFAYHKSLKPLMLDWFIENITWSVQDQISLPYVLSKHKIKYSIFSGNILKNKYVVHNLYQDKSIIGKLTYNLNNLHLAIKSLLKG
jgi:Protein of unknown function (DUF616)